MECSDAELSILLTDDREIADLNRDYRNKSSATDVLSFALAEGEGAEFRGDALGDVVISIETARRQAVEIGHSLAEEVARLLTHGTLHLLGFDHEDVTDEEAERMRVEEERLAELLQPVLMKKGSGVVLKN